MLMFYSCVNQERDQSRQQGNCGPEQTVLLIFGLSKLIINSMLNIWYIHLQGGEGVIKFWQIKFSNFHESKFLFIYIQTNTVSIHVSSKL